MPRLMTDLLKNCFTHVERPLKLYTKMYPPPISFAEGYIKGVANGPIVIGLFALNSEPKRIHPSKRAIVA